MLILLSNDDGIDAPGLAALAEGLAGLGEIVVSAPAGEQSARSHAFTMHRPLRVTERRPGWHAVHGTPVDAVYIGMHHLAPRRPDLVVGGINRGTNLGDDVHYSGTVAVAREAALAGIPAIAVSLEVPGDRGAAPGEALHYATAARVARRVAERVLAEGLPPNGFLNVNVPNRPPGEEPPLAAATLGRRHYAPTVTACADPRGGRSYWIGGPHRGFSGEEDADGTLFERGFATVLPLWPDFTDRRALPRVRSWFPPPRPA